eukprot:3834679-Karenia_brevis.AAC.1
MEIQIIIDGINEEAESRWRAVEVMIPEGLTDPWVKALGTYRPGDDDKDFHVRFSSKSNRQCKRPQVLPRQEFSTRGPCGGLRD